MRNANLLIISLLALSSSAKSDHVPPSYAYQAVTGKNAVQVVRVEGHTQFTPLPRAKAQPEVDKKMNDMLTGFFSKSLAGIVLDGNGVIYERYKSGKEENPYPAFSVTKGVTSILIGYAQCQGYINDLERRAYEYVPEIKNTVWGDARILSLLKMKSGAPRQALHEGGDYLHPNSSEISMLTGRNDVINLFHQNSKLSGKGAEDLSWTYNNFDTLALGLVIEAATGKKLYEYYKETLWNDFKPEHPTYWFLDSKGVTLSHAHLHISLRDAARLGKFLLRVARGEHPNSCLEKYISKATQPHIQVTQIQGNNELLGYGYQFWLEISHGDTVRMSGHQGQEIMVNFRTGKVVSIFSAYNAAREKMYKSDGIFKWLSTED